MGLQCSINYYHPSDYTTTENGHFITSSLTCSPINLTLIAMAIMRCALQSSHSVQPTYINRSVVYPLKLNGIKKLTTQNPIQLNEVRAREKLMCPLLKYPGNVHLHVPQKLIIPTDENDAHVQLIVFDSYTLASQLN